MTQSNNTAIKSILSLGRHMGRDRYQEGSLVIVGKRVKKWRGHFYVYEKQADGSDKRRFRNVLLGLKSEIDKGQAKQKLRDLIARETRNVAPAPAAVTLRWFYENRFLPQKEEQWKVTSRPKTKRFIENYLLKRFGDFFLADLDKFTLQTYLNELAPNFSKSVLAKTRVYFNSILGEAVELELLPKNPAAKLVVPRSGKKAANQPLTPEQIPQVLFHLGDRDRLIVRMFLVLGLRAGEMFALRWNDKQGNSLRIDTAIVDGIEVETKTEGSDAAVCSRSQSKRSLNSGAQPPRTSCRTASSFHPHEEPRSPHLLYVYGPAYDREGRAGPPAPQLLGDHAGALHQVRAGECARGCRIARPSAEESARGFRAARELNPTSLEGEP